MSVISGLPLTMDDLLSPPFDGTTSTPCMSTASSFVTTSSYCDDIFKLDPFSEPLENEVRLTATDSRKTLGAKIVLEPRNWFCSGAYSD